MPLTVHKGESKQEFISRCIAQEIRAGRQEKQAAAICYSAWRKRNKK